MFTQPQVEEEQTPEEFMEFIQEVGTYDYVEKKLGKRNADIHAATMLFLHLALMELFVGHGFEVIDRLDGLDKELGAKGVEFLIALVAINRRDLERAESRTKEAREELGKEEESDSEEEDLKRFPAEWDDGEDEYEGEEPLPTNNSRIFLPRRNNRLYQRIEDNWGQELDDTERATSYADKTFMDWYNLRWGDQTVDWDKVDSDSLRYEFHLLKDYLDDGPDPDKGDPALIEELVFDDEEEMDQLADEIRKVKTEDESLLG